MNQLRKNICTLRLVLEVKKIMTIGILAGLISLAFTCERNKKLNVEHTPAPISKDSEPPDESSPTFAESSEGTRLALVEHCGKCHQSTLASHKAGAIAIFDLDAMEEWHIKLTMKNLEGVDGRTKNKSAVTDEERAYIEEFLALKRELLN
ncbi:MAG: hypothetical protein ACR2MT_03510 [Aurantibacter sp.]